MSVQVDPPKDYRIVSLVPNRNLQGVVSFMTVRERRRRDRKRLLVLCLAGYVFLFIVYTIEVNLGVL